MHPQFRTCLLFLIALCISGIPKINQSLLSADTLYKSDITELNPEKPMIRNLSAGEKHDYQISVYEGQYVSIDIDQHGIDVVAELLNIEGKIIVAFDNEYRTEGEEKIETVATAAGNILLRVKPSSQKAPPGKYEIRTTEARDSTEEDRLMNETRRLAYKFNREFLAGEYEDAQKSIEQALSISEKILGDEHPFMATLLYDLARFYDVKHDFGQSVPLLERAVGISEKTLGSDHPRTIEISKLLAEVYFDTNEVAKTEEMLKHGYDISQKTLGPNHYLVAQYLVSLADFSNDTKKREEFLNRAFEIAKETVGEEHVFYGDVLNALGAFHVEISNYQQAEKLLNRAREVYEKTTGPMSISNVRSLLILGRLAREQKNYVKAEEHYRKAISIVQQDFGPSSPRLAPILNNLANIYRIKGDYSKSLEAHLQVLQISESSFGPYHQMTLMSLGNIARTYAAESNITEAVKFQSRVDEVIERNVELNLAIGSEQEKISFMKQWFPSRTDRTISLNVNLAPDNPTATALAALVILQRKGRVLDAMSESFVSLQQHATPEVQGLLEKFNESTAQLARLVLNGPTRLSFKEHQKKVNELEERKQRLEEQISRISTEFRANAQLVTLDAIQAAIPNDAALIEFAIYRPFDSKAEHTDAAYKESRYIAYVLNHQKEIQWKELGTAKDIDASIAAFRGALRNDWRGDVRQIARMVDKKVMQPIRPLLGDATHLLLSPDGILNLIPFEALVDEQNEYLVKRFSFTYLTSGRDLLRLQIPRASKTGPIVVANPRFGEPEEIAKTEEKTKPAALAGKENKPGTTTGTDLSEIYFKPLTGTAQEAKAIKSLFSEAVVLSGTQATEASLKKISAPSILHIATHGFFLTDDSAFASSPGETRAINATVKRNPLVRSGLALSGANLKGRTGEDGILTALEATGLNLWGTNLVTLSACNTGLGEVKTGDGVYGLRRAFLLAGTETVVMSLWPVSDSVLPEMMRKYYKELKQGLGRGEALRNVKLSMLKQKKYTHPYYWASFIQSGEWTNLKGNAENLLLPKK